MDEVLDRAVDEDAQDDEGEGLRWMRRAEREDRQKEDERRVDDGYREQPSSSLGRLHLRIDAPGRHQLGERADYRFLQCMHRRFSSLPLAQDDNAQPSIPYYKRYRVVPERE